LQIVTSENEQPVKLHDGKRNSPKQRDNQANAEKFG